MKKISVWLGIVVGVVCVALAIYYWITPAGLLPSFMPGFIPGSSITHFKHGLAALIVGILALIYAWFASAKKVS